MSAINWKTILHHPSEIVRLDEQLRLKSEFLIDLKEKIDFPFYYIGKEVDNHLKMIYNFRCYLHIEGTKYFQTNLFSRCELDVLKNVSGKKNTSPFCAPTFTNQTENQFNLYLLVMSEKKNTEDIFRKLIFVFLNMKMPRADFTEKSNVANIIINKCSFALE